MSKPRIVVVGSSNTDLIVKVPRIPRPGETVLGGEFVTAAGGKGANQAVAAARAGGAVTFVACVGDDAAGRQALAGFRRDRIRTDWVMRTKHEPSGVALICVAANGQNSIAVASGANARLSPDDVLQAKSEFARADALLVQLEIPLATVKAVVQLANKYRVPVILNPAPANPLPDELLRRISILTPNESEAELLTGVRIKDNKTAERAARRLHARGVRTVIITLGSKGVLVSDGAASWRPPAFSVKAVDTTAAGDVFNGALAVALAEGQPLAEAVRFASAAAALSVTREGAQPSAPRRTEIVHFLKARSHRKSR